MLTINNGRFALLQATASGWRAHTGKGTSFYGEKRSILKQAAAEHGLRFHYRDLFASNDGKKYDIFKFVSKDGKKCDISNWPQPITVD